MTTRPARRRRDSRLDVLRAAEREFAAHGYDGAGVDRIAHRARVNKAMIYYHFGSKLGLYREIVRDGFRAVAAEAGAAVAAVPSATAQLDAYLASLVGTLTARPHLVPMMLAEIAGGGRHLDAETLGIMVGVFGVVRDVLVAGQKAREFDALDPLLTHLFIVGSAMLYLANEPVRARIQQLGLPEGPRTVPIGPEPFLHHMGVMLRRALRARPEEAHG